MIKLDISNIDTLVEGYKKDLEESRKNRPDLFDDNLTVEEYTILLHEIFGETFNRHSPEFLRIT